MFALPFPILNQHIERINTPYFRAACNHVNGPRQSQEDAHSIVPNVNGKNLMAFAIFDGHGDDKISLECADGLIQNVFGPLGMVNPPSKSGVFAAFGRSAKEEPKYFLDLPDEEIVKHVCPKIFEFDSKFRAPPYRFMGSTAIVVLAQLWDLQTNKAILDPPEATPTFCAENRELFGIKLFSFNIGDSRAMLIPHHNANPQDAYVAMSYDHNPTDKLEEKRINRAGAWVSANRVCGGLAMSRAVGDWQYKDAYRDGSILDIFSSLTEEWRYPVIAVPELTTFVAKYGDVLVMTCDGIFEGIINRAVVSRLVHGFIRESVDHHKKKQQPQQQQQLTKTEDNSNPTPDAPYDYHLDLLYDPAEVARELIMEALASGSTDNQSAMIISFTSFHNCPPTNPYATARCAQLKDYPKFEIIPGHSGVTLIQARSFLDIEKSHLRHHPFLRQQEERTSGEYFQQNVAPTEDIHDVVAENWWYGETEEMKKLHHIFQAKLEEERKQEELERAEELKYRQELAAAQEKEQANYEPLPMGTPVDNNNNNNNTDNNNNNHDQENKENDNEIHSDGGVDHLLEHTASGSSSSTTTTSPTTPHLATPTTSHEAIVKQSDFLTIPSIFPLSPHTLPTHTHHIIAKVRYPQGFPQDGTTPSHPSDRMFNVPNQYLQDRQKHEEYLYHVNTALLKLNKVLDDTTPTPKTLRELQKLAAEHNVRILYTVPLMLYRVNRNVAFRPPEDEAIFSPPPPDAHDSAGLPQEDHVPVVRTDGEEVLGENASQDTIAPTPANTTAPDVPVGQEQHQQQQDEQKQD